MIAKTPIPEPSALSRRSLLTLLGAALPTASALAQAIPPGVPGRLTFDGRTFLFRFAKNGLHEFTPEPETDLHGFTNMLTVNVLKTVTDPEALARMANGVVARSQQLGRIMKTASKPAKPGSPAEHLIVAVLGQPKFLEAAFTRVFLLGGCGFAMVYSYRIYQEKAGPAMAEWLNANGNRLEANLVKWNDFALIEPMAKA
ncbi:MAG: hypothetical protein O9322_02810 [Beijerinckiaceae bacterium]|nr:hypothetical protein [Beijerinckiaceae bacterium]MCZ8301495.1 hypothetical protein [Beijerinckiaceae bacterium]